MVTKAQFNELISKYSSKKYKYTIIFTQLDDKLIALNPYLIGDAHNEDTPTRFHLIEYGDNKKLFMELEEML